MRLFFQILILSLMIFPFQNCGEIKLVSNASIKPAPQPIPPDPVIQKLQKTMSLHVVVNTASSLNPGCWLSIFESADTNSVPKTLQLPLRNNCEPGISGNRFMTILKEDAQTLRMAFRFNYLSQNITTVEVLDLNKDTFTITPVMNTGALSGFSLGSHSGLIYHGDCDNDGEKDILIQNNSGKYVCFSMKTGANYWTLPNGPDFPGNSYTVNDIDGDSAPDIQRLNYYGTTPILSYWSISSATPISTLTISELLTGQNFYQLNFDINGDQWPDYTIQGNQKIRFYSGRDKTFLFEVANVSVNASNIVWNITKGRFLNSNEQILAIQEGDGIQLVSLSGQLLQKINSADINLTELVSRYGNFGSSISQSVVDVDRDGIDELSVGFGHKISLVSFKNMTTKTHLQLKADNFSSMSWNFHFTREYLSGSQ